ncbi:pseudouridine synthase [Nitrobacter sp. JJSN]|uniref:pseudouridine synthase n=1 Tax=Nitrobacter sp. JJSN TaxID=3453033 RepID=UPI003F75A32E
MPRDNDKDNASSRGRRDRPSGGKDRPKGRSGAARGPDKKLAKRGFAGKSDREDGDKRPYAGKSAGAKSYAKKPYAGAGKPYAGKRDGDAARPRFKRDDGGETRAYTPRGDSPRGERPAFKRDDRAPRADRGDTRPAGRFADKKFGEKRPYTPRGEGFRKDGDRPQRARPQGDRPYSARPPREGGGEKRPYTPRGDRPFADKKFSHGAPDRGSRGPRKEFGDRPDRGESKPWQKREAGPRDDRGGPGQPRFSRPREDRPERAAGGDRGPRKFDRPQGDRPRYDRPSGDRPRFDRPRQERPRHEGGDDRPRRDNEDDSKVFAKRPAFGGRGAYRERKPDEDRRGARPEPKPKKAGERIAKMMSRAGLASRRDAEEWVTQGRVAVNGRVINSPALDVTASDVITVDGQPLPERERTRLFLYHKPRGLMTTHADPEGRPTVFDNLPEGLPRLISIGRLDFNTEGLLLLTNDGGLARALELPDTGWLRRYRVRAHGEVTQAQLDALKNGVEVDGIKYGSIDATLERDQGANVWLVFAIREGKNREVRNVMAHLGLEVNRLIRISYGPFQLAEIAEGQVEEVKTRVLREQLGEKIAALANANFAGVAAEAETPKLGRDGTPLRSKKDNKARTKRAVIADHKGRSVVVQRTGSDEARARNEAEANGYGPPRRPKRGYHGKRDLTPRD